MIRGRRGFFGLIGMLAGFCRAQTTPPADQQVPLCPVCKTPSSLPNLPLVVGDPSGNFTAIQYPGALVIMCANPGCRTLFGAAPGDVHAAAPQALHATVRR